MESEYYADLYADAELRVDALRGALFVADKLAEAVKQLSSAALNDAGLTGAVQDAIDHLEAAAKAYRSAREGC